MTEYFIEIPDKPQTSFTNQFLSCQETGYGQMKKIGSWRIQKSPQHDKWKKLSFTVSWLKKPNSVFSSNTNVPSPWLVSVVTRLKNNNFDSFGDFRELVDSSFWLQKSP